MSALPWIVGGLGVGVLYYLWQQSQNATPDDFCAKACKAAGSFCIDGGASCRATNGVLGSIGNGIESELDPGGVYFTERDRREGVNNGLNGVADVLNPVEGVGAFTARELISKGPFATNVQQPVGAHTLRYKNGCVPLFDAPGFAKCAVGTLDMYSTAINVGAGSPFDLSENDLTTDDTYLTLGDELAAPSRPWAHLNKNNAMTGGSGDPTTRGPFGTNPDAPYWYVRGQRVNGTATTAPRAVVMQHFAHADPGAELTTDQQIANLSDADAIALVPINADPSVIVTNIGAPCGTPNPGYSWVATNAKTGAGYWTRTPSGSTDKLMPCPTLDTNLTVSHTIELGP